MPDLGITPIMIQVRKRFFLSKSMLYLRSSAFICGFIKPA